MGIRLDDLPPEYRAQVLAKLKKAGGGDGQVAASTRRPGGRRRRGELVPAPPAPPGARPPAALIPDADLLDLDEESWRHIVMGHRKLDGYCNTHSWTALHVPRTKTKRGADGKPRTMTVTTVTGLPDVVAWSTLWPGRHLAIELKTEDGSLEAHQRDRLIEMHRSGFETYAPVRPRHAAELDLIFTTHPDDWPDGWTPSCAFTPNPSGGA